MAERRKERKFNSCIRMKLTESRRERELFTELLIDWFLFLVLYTSPLLSWMLRNPIAWSIITICTEPMIKLHFLFICRGELASIMRRQRSLKCFLYPHSPLSWLPAFSQTTLVKLVFRSLGARVNNIKFGDGVCTAHVQERAVLHDVERMLPRYSSFSRFLSVWQGGRRERERERERERASRGTRLGHMAHLRLNSHISRLSWSG